MDKTAKPKISKTKSVLLAILISPLINCGGVKEVVKKDNVWIGTLHASDKILYYMEGCKNPKKCSDSKTERDIDRYLECGNPSISSQYEKHYEIRYKTSFEIKQIVDIVCYGLECSFAGGYAVAILEDSRGILSTRLMTSMSLEDHDVC